MIRAAVAELELEGAAAESQSENLMAEANAEHRLVGLQQLARVLNRVIDGSRIAGTVAQEDAVDICCKYVLCGRRRWKDLHFAAIRRESAEDVPLDAEVV